jgi:hypothetical protein
MPGRLEKHKREILSPNYQPFKIFFGYRKTSPYVSHRSQISELKNNSPGTISIHRKKSYLDIHNKKRAH